MLYPARLQSVTQLPPGQHRTIIYSCDKHSSPQYHVQQRHVQGFLWPPPSLDEVYGTRWTSSSNHSKGSTKGLSLRDEC